MAIVNIDRRFQFLAAKVFPSLRFFGKNIILIQIGDDGFDHFDPVAWSIFMYFCGGPRGLAKGGETPKGGTADNEGGDQPNERRMFFWYLLA